MMLAPPKGNAAPKKLNKEGKGAVALASSPLPHEEVIKGKKVG